MRDSVAAIDDTGVTGVRLLHDDRTHQAMSPGKAWEPRCRVLRSFWRRPERGGCVETITPVGIVRSRLAARWRRTARGDLACLAAG